MLVSSTAVIEAFLECSQVLFSRSLAPQRLRKTFLLVGNFGMLSDFGD